MVLLTFAVLYALCAAVLLLAVAQDRRRSGDALGRGPAQPPSSRQGRGNRHELVFTTQH